MESLVLKKLLALLCLLFARATLHGQARPAADRLGDLQVGVSYSSADSDYLPNRIRGLGFYSDFDFRYHWGAEFSFHQLDDPNSIVYERTYEVGGRYILRPRLQHVTPYLKAMYGRGVFNFPPPYAPPYPQNLPAANLAYNLVGLGGGVDFAVHPRVNVRVEYEWQKWFSFPPNGLNPQLITFGAAYHFPAGKPK
jgi:hypothetical protein